jgi:hypothetical protein
MNGSGTTGVYCALVNTTSYTFSRFHQFYATVIGSPDAVIGTDQEIGTKTFVEGVFDGGDLTYTSVTGSVVGALVLYVKNAGATSTWRLIAYIDTSVTGLPVTPNGGNITITWANSSSPDTTGIFAL